MRSGIDIIRDYSGLYWPVYLRFRLSRECGPTKGKRLQQITPGGLFWTLPLQRWPVRNTMEAMDGWSGDVIRARREQMGFSRRALAKACGISHATLAAIEQGQRRSPRPDTLYIIARALRLDLDSEVAPSRTQDSPAIESALELLRAMPPERQQLTVRLLLVLADQDLSAD